MFINYTGKHTQDPSIMESDMFVNSAIIKPIEKQVYNNIYILFVIGNNIVVNSAVMKHHRKQN